MEYLKPQSSGQLQTSCVPIGVGLTSNLVCCVTGRAYVTKLDLFDLANLANRKGSQCAAMPKQTGQIMSARFQTRGTFWYVSTGADQTQTGHWLNLHTFMSRRHFQGTPKQINRFYFQNGWRQSIFCERKTKKFTSSITGRGKCPLISCGRKSNKLIRYLIKRESFGTYTASGTLLRLAKLPFAPDSRR